MKYANISIDKIRTTDIYGIFNVVTKRWYVGQSTHVLERFYQHMAYPEKMLADYNRYGRDSFRLYILAENVPLFQANEAERKWHDFFSNFCETYNGMRPTLKARICGTTEEDYLIPEYWHVQSFFFNQNPFPPQVSRVR